MPAVPIEDLFAGQGGEPSEMVRARVLAARRTALARTPRAGRNAALTQRDLARVAPLAPPVAVLLRRAAESFHLSARGVVRIRRLARTIADLAGCGSIEPEHAAEALQYRLPDGTRGEAG